MAAAKPKAPVEPTKLAKLQGLRWAIAGNSLNTFFAQFTLFGSVFVLFLDTLGMDKSQIGLLLSLLPFASIIAPLAAPSVARYRLQAGIPDGVRRAQGGHPVSPV